VSGLWLTRDQARTLETQAKAARPREACGLIAGHGTQAQQILPAENVAADPERFYVIDPAALAKHLPALERQGQALIAFYHSHPQGDPIPSQTDIAEVTYGDIPYLIIGLRGGEARFAAWRFDRGRALPVALHIGDVPPPEGFAPDDALSKPQRVAVVVAGIIAVIALIVVSILLLPPAPPIP
jgi:proteasome lid subunit RPN8/RPN11